MNKKGVSILLLSAMLFSVSGCGKTAKRVDDKTETKTEETNNKLTIGKVDLNDPNLEEKWKKEPAYGRKIIINFDGGLCASTLGVTHAKGYFAKQGIETEVVNNPEPKDAIATGKIDVMVEHISTSLVPAINGLNITFTRAVNTGCRTMFVLNESEIKSTKDLEGKVVGVNGGIGSGDHNISLRFFAKDNVDQTKVKFKPVESAALIQAMKNGEISACVLSDQYAKEFIEKGVIRAIRSITWDDDFKIEPCCVLILNKKFVEENPITAAKITEAHKQASDWVEDHKEETADIVKANNWGSGNRDIDLYFLNAYSFRVSDEQTEKSLNDIVKDYKNFGLIDKNKEATDILKEVWKPINQK